MIEDIEKIILHLEDSSDTDEELLRFALRRLKQLDLENIDRGIVMGKIADRFAKTNRKNLSSSLYERAIELFEGEDMNKDPWFLLNKGLLNEKVGKFTTALKLYYECRESEVVGDEDFLRLLLKAIIERTKGKLSIEKGLLDNGGKHYNKSAKAFQDLSKSEKSLEMKKKWVEGRIEMRNLAKKYLKK